jgi:hypothetical protein
MVFELRKSVHGIKRYDKKNKKNWLFLVNPTFLAENLVDFGQIKENLLVKTLFFRFEKSMKFCRDCPKNLNFKTIGRIFYHPKNSHFLTKIFNYISVEQSTIF